MPHVLWVGIVVVAVAFVVVVGGVVLVLVIIGVVDLVEPNGTTVNTCRRESICRNRCELPNHSGWQQRGAQSFADIDGQSKMDGSGTG